MILGMQGICKGQAEKHVEFSMVSPTQDLVYKNRKDGWKYLGEVVGCFQY